MKSSLLTEKERGVWIEDMKAECHNALDRVARVLKRQFKVRDIEAKAMQVEAIAGLKAYMNLK